MWPAHEIRSAIAAREVSPVSVLERALERIDSLDPAINGFCHVDAERARVAARAAEQALYDGSVLGPLHGVPFAVKDLTATAGIPTTLGSKGLAAVDYRPTESAPVHERMLAAGGIFVGKTMTPELGNKGTCDSPLFGRTSNPWDLTRTSGGSSGGSAAAVAAGMVPLAEGSDGAGSVRVPASCCGVVGMKPSIGRVPRYPLPSPFETMVTHGPLARNVKDAAMMLDAICGPDERDPFSLPAPDQPFLSAVAEPEISNMRIAYSRDLGFAHVQPQVRACTDAAAEAFESELGAQVAAAGPQWEDPSEAEELIWSTILGLMGHDFITPLESPDEMDPHLQDLIDRGRRVTAWDFYRAAYSARGLMYLAMYELFERFELLLTPTLAVEPFSHPAEQRPGPSKTNGQAIHPFSGWLLTYPFNLTGHPAISVPCGFSPQGLPIGLQIVGPRHADARVLEAARAWERIRPPAEWSPPLGRLR